MSSPALLVAIPLLGALLALIGKLTHRELAGSVAAVALMPAAAFPLAAQARTVLAGSTIVSNLGGWEESVGIALRVDSVAWLSSSLVVLIASIISLAAIGDSKYRANFFFFLSLLLSGMQIVTTTADIFTMFVGFEIIAIAAYVLIAYEKSDAGLVASLKYLILSSVGILFFLFGIFLVYRDFGTLSLTIIRSRVETGSLDETQPIHLAVAALCVGIGVRTAFVPFHTWLPEAHAYAPHPVSAILSGVLIKVSLFAMLRIVSVLNAGYLLDLLLWIGAGTALAAVVWALCQSDIKRLLAFHSISQMGYILAAFGAAQAGSVGAVFAHSFAHALFKSLLFLAAGTAIEVCGTRDLYRMRGLSRRAPLVSIGLLVGALSIAAIPPFNGFASKQLATGTVPSGLASTLLLLTSVGTVASFIKVGRLVFVPPAAITATAADGSESRVEVQDSGRADSPWLTGIALLGFSVLCLATGVFGNSLSDRLFRALTMGSTFSQTSGFPAIAAATETKNAFSATKLIETIWVTGLGVGLYLLATSPLGRRVTHTIAGFRPGLSTVLLFFVAGLALFVLVAA